jgi:4-amino-4-deoxy-L-arabinose transferase-like glycosyltransferase
MLGAGTAAGLALLSKYMAIFTVLSLCVHLLSCRRCLLATLAPWLAALLVVILFAPVLLWNYAHDWASLTFQGSRALPSGFSLQRAALDLGGQLLYLLPWIALSLLFALACAMRCGARDEAGWLLACLAFAPIVAFSLAGLWTKVLPHWPAIGWLFTTWTAACRDRADATARAAPDRDRDCEPSGLRSVTGGRSGSYGLDGAPRAGSCE